MSVPSSRLPIFVGIVVLVAACGDEVVNSPTDPSAEVRAVTSDGSTLRDSEIDTEDTYFAFDVTEESDGTTESNPMANRYVELGYESDGDFRFNVYRDPTASTAHFDPPSHVRTVENWVQVWDAAGGLVLSASLSDAFAQAGIPAISLFTATPIDALYETEDPDSDKPTFQSPTSGDPSLVERRLGIESVRMAPDWIEVRV